MTDGFIASGQKPGNCSFLRRTIQWWKDVFITLWPLGRTPQVIQRSGGPRGCLVGCLPWPFLAVETVHGEGKCPLTSPVLMPRLRPASWRHFPFERDKRGWMVVWHRRILFHLNNSLSCLELQFAPRSRPRGEPPGVSAPWTRASSPCTVPHCRELSLGGLTFSTFPPARGDPPPLRVEWCVRSLDCGHAAARQRRGRAQLVSGPARRLTLGNQN